MSEAVKEMLTTDIKLKEEVSAKLDSNITLKEEIFAKLDNVVRTLIITIAVICVCTSALVLFSLAYYSKTKGLVFSTIQVEREFMRKERDSLRVLREDWSRLQDTTQLYVRPIYDSVKINWDTIK